jgi:hypothetical protein
MSPLTLERSQKIVKICQGILSRERHVHSVSVLSRNGRVIESRFRDDSTVAGLSRRDLEMLYMQRVLQGSMSREFDDRLGALRFTVRYREGLIEVAVPFHGGLILVLGDEHLQVSSAAGHVSEIVAALGSWNRNELERAEIQPILS